MKIKCGEGWKPGTTGGQHWPTDADGFNSGGHRSLGWIRDTTARPERAAACSKWAHHRRTATCCYPSVPQNIEMEGMDFRHSHICLSCMTNGRVVRA